MTNVPAVHSFFEKEETKKKKKPTNLSPLEFDDNRDKFHWFDNFADSRQRPSDQTNQVSYPLRSHVIVKKNDKKISGTQLGFKMKTARFTIAKKLSKEDKCVNKKKKRGTCNYAEDGEHHRARIADHIPQAVSPSELNTKLDIGSTM